MPRGHFSLRVCVEVILTDFLLYYIQRGIEAERVECNHIIIIISQHLAVKSGKRSARARFFESPLGSRQFHQIRVAVSFQEIASENMSEEREGEKQPYIWYLPTWVSRLHEAGGGREISLVKWNTAETAFQVSESLSPLSFFPFFFFFFSGHLAMSVFCALRINAGRTAEKARFSARLGLLLLVQLSGFCKGGESWTLIHSRYAHKHRRIKKN